MRHAPTGAVLLVLSLAAPLLAQSGKDVRIVKVPQADVRCGPSMKEPFFVTNRLQAGDSVEVVEEKPDGWLKIRPPAKSTSWVSTKFLEQPFPTQPNRVVNLDGINAPVYPSPADPTNVRPQVTTVKLKPGHLVVGIRLKPGQQEDEGTWLEIESPESEPRYIRAEAVDRRGSAVVQTSGTTGAGNLTKSTAPSANATAPAEELRQKAVQADLDGNAAEAIRLYDRIVAQFSTAYPELARKSRARADYLRNEHGERDADSQPRSPVATPVKLGANVPARGTSTFTGNEATRTYRGRLSKAGSIGRQTAYMLQLDRAAGWMSMLYVVAAPGGSLEQYAGRSVEVSGEVIYINELRAYKMEAAQVRPAE